MEFFTGVALFQTHDNLEHLAMMEQVMGKMPDRFARQGARSKPEYFKEGNRLAWPQAKATRQSRKEVRACRSLQVGKPLASIRRGRGADPGCWFSQETIPQTDNINRQFLDLVRRLLTFDPQQRITVRDALAHPYFSLHIPEEQY